MRVEFRRRPAKGAQEPLERSASASPSLVKAYSESCFESPTSFYIASPEHPKLGKWTQPSTLKYSLPPQHHTAHNATRCVDDAALFAPDNGRPHTTGRQPITREKNKPTAALNRSRPKTSSHHRLKESDREKRPASPMGSSLLVGYSNSSPASSIRGRREAPQIDTPVSGRVAPLHQRSNQTSTLPSSPTLCGSFDRQYHPRVKSASAERPTQHPVTFDWSTAVVDPGISNQSPIGFDTVGMGFNTNFSEGGAAREELQRSRHEQEHVDTPDVRYRVTKLDESLLGNKSRSPKEVAARQGRSGEDGCTPPANQTTIRPSDQSDSELPTPGIQNLPRPDKSQLVASTPCGEEAALVAGIDRADPWIGSQLEPFMSALRLALLRDRPDDVAAYALTFSGNWRLD